MHHVSRDAAQALLDLAADAASDDVRSSAVRRLAGMVAAESARLRSAANSETLQSVIQRCPASLRGSATPALPAASASLHQNQPPLAEFIRNAVCLGVPHRRPSDPPPHARATAIARALLSLDRERFDRVLVDLGLLVSAAVIDRVASPHVRTLLAEIDPHRARFQSLVRLLPAVDDGWPVEVLQCADLDGSGSRKLERLGTVAADATALRLAPGERATIARRLAPHRPARPASDAWMTSISTCIGEVAG